MTTKKRLLLLLIVAFVLAFVAGTLIGTALTSPTIAIVSTAWDDTEMTEEEYNNNFTQSVIESDTAAGGVDVRNMIAGYNRCSNDDKVGWIYYPGMCDYPVLYSGDTYYLNHTVDKVYSANGAIFCDAATTSFFDGYTLIHGHHLKNGKMFTKLVNLKNSDTFKANRYFYTYNGSAVYQYRVIAATLVNGAKEIIPGSFRTEEEKMTYLNSLISRSMYGCAYDESELLNVVVLHTCDYTFNNAHLLILGVMEDEVATDG